MPGLCLQLFQQHQGFHGRHAIDIDPGQLREHLAFRRLKQAQLNRLCPVCIPRGDGIAHMASVRRMVLDPGQNLFGPFDHFFRDAGELGHLNPVASVGAAGNQFAKENDPVVPLLDCDVEVLDSPDEMIILITSPAAEEVEEEVVDEEGEEEPEVIEKGKKEEGEEEE